MERESLLIPRYIREHPQFRYTIKYNEHCNMYILYYKTEEAVRSMAIPSGVCYQVLTKMFNNGIAWKIWDICVECDAWHYDYNYMHMICHMYMSSVHNNSN